MNQVGLGGPDLSGAFTSHGHNLIGDGTGGTGFTDGVNGDMVGTSANPIDPKLGPLQNNGGPTQTHGPSGRQPGHRPRRQRQRAADRPARRGFPRKKDGNGDGLAIVDIGAFETVGPLRRQTMAG